MGKILPDRECLKWDLEVINMELFGLESHRWKKMQSSMYVTTF